MTSSSLAPKAWLGQIAVGDTQLQVCDTGGPGRAVIYLNGCYARMGDWRKVTAALGSDQFRHIRFDARGRGRSGISRDYGFDACLADIDVVLDQREVRDPLLVGWSYGATLALYWAQQHPGRVQGVVAVDGAMPFGLTGQAGRDEIRRLFRRMSWAFPIARCLGLVGKMSGQQHAEINIEANEKTAECGPVLTSVTCPVLYVLGTGGNLGASHQVMEEGRATLAPYLERNRNLRVFEKVASDHAQILRKSSDTVVRAIRELHRQTSEFDK